MLCNINFFDNDLFLGGSSWDSDDYSYSQNSQDHTSYHQRPDSYHSATQESNASQVRPIYYVHNDILPLILLMEIY